MFLGLRAIRIYPALVMEAVLSALLLGSFFTTSPLAAYFCNHTYYRYMFNVIGDITYWLSGAFADNPNPYMVNRQLWTVPFELYCHASISVAFLIGVVRRPLILLIGAPIFQLVHFAHDYHKARGWPSSPFPDHVVGPSLSSPSLPVSSSTNTGNASLGITSCASCPGYSQHFF